MSPISIFCLILLGLLFLTCLVPLFVPIKKNEGISVHIDDKAGVKITRSDEGMRLDIVYETIEDRPADYVLCPDLVNDSVVEGGANRDFWLEISNLEDLPMERREAAIRKLAEFGFIHKDRVKDFVLPEDPQDENSAPDPDEIDPAEADDFNRAHPDTDIDIDMPDGMSFEDITI